MHSSEGLVGLADLTAYLRMLSVLLNAGVNLLACLRILDESITFEPLREANRRLIEDIQGGETLSKAMEKHPKIFSGLLVCLVRAGEVGGVLDDTLERAAGFYRQQAEYRRLRFSYLGTARSLGEGQEDDYLRALRGMEVKLVIQYFCYMLGTMLGAGVPILQAMEAAATILPELRAHDEVRLALAEGVRRAMEDIRQGRGMAETFAAAGLPAGVVTLVRIGEDEGTLDRMMLRAGDLLGAEIEGKMQEALGLNYF